jgi:hypothetical protein
MIREVKPFQVYCIKSEKGRGYEVFTFNEETNQHLKITPFLKYYEAMAIMKGFSQAGWKNKFTLRQGDME